MPPKKLDAIGSETFFFKKVSQEFISNQNPKKSLKKKLSYGLINLFVRIGNSPKSLNKTT